MTVPATLKFQTGAARTGALRAAVAFEWTKLWSVRSTRWALLAATVLGGAAALLLGLSASASAANGVDVTMPAPHLAAQAIPVAQLAAICLATLAVTSEYASRTITTTLQAVPVRRRLLLAKASVVGAVLFVAGAVTSAGGTVAVGSVLGEPGRFTASDAVLTALGMGVHLTLLGVMALGIGTCLRSAAGAVTTAIMILFAVPPVLRVIGVDWLGDVSNYTPGTAGQVFMTQAGDPYGSGAALAVLLAWALVPALAGYAVLRSSDA